jgi:hypothetical protein
MFGFDFRQGQLLPLCGKDVRGQVVARGSDLVGAEARGRQDDDEDLPGHLLRSDVWKHVCLPFIAFEDANYEIGNSLWHRQLDRVYGSDRIAFAPGLARRKQY